MIAQIIFAVMPSLALGFTSPHREEAFLGVAHKHHSAPDDEMSPNMHFEPLSTTMKCVIGLTLQYIIVYTALGISRSYHGHTWRGEPCEALRRESGCS